jgi:hypothetical protein
VLVTDGGDVVAELTPPGQFSDEATAPAALVALAKAGRLTPGAENAPSVYPRLPRALKHRRAAELLDDERSDR